ncbi:DENN domain [Ostreococcus tauri]|uniref:DENN domain n=1 Tax=Ostreococcus tauri TaxID=70448 RepID=A0A096P7I4_OSTTA|nr:DENN domain [Ostreococcus tauri]CEG00176.1 DENN domain [Ostreococcus tauri]|eukprot:XP_003082718.2 DENN domain [Ostreococcus tauri]
MSLAAFIAVDDERSVAVVRASKATAGASETSDLSEMCASALDGRFCFPERAEGADEPSRSATAERFTFCLTRANGTRVLGRVRRRGRIACAALSERAWFEYFDDALAGCEDEALRVLSLVEGNGESSSSSCLVREIDADTALGEYLDRAFGTGAPRAGETRRVGIPWSAFAGVATRSVTLTAPDLKKEFNGGIKFTSLLDCGHVDAVLALFAALVTERRVVLTGSRLEFVSGAVHAANAALYPLSWQHIFLPVLPEGFLDYLTAPMPFLIGLHSSLVSVMKRLPCDDIFTLDLDTGEFTYFDEDLRSMPAGPFTLLRVGLLREMEKSRGQDSQAVAQVFRTFFSSVLGQYKQHIKGVVAHPPPKDAIISDSLWLDQDEFMATKHAGILAAMRGTQMYEVFVRQRLNMCAQVARKTGFVPLGDEIVDFDLEEPDITLSDLMMRGQALGEQFASASSHALSEASSVFKSTVAKAKLAYSSSKTIKNMREAFTSKKSELAASMKKFSKKSSEDFAAKWAEWTEGDADGSIVKSLSFDAGRASPTTSARKGADVIHGAPAPTSGSASKPSPSASVEQAEPEPSAARADEVTDVDTVGNALRSIDLMSFNDAADYASSPTPSKRPSTAPTLATPNFLDD